MDHAVWMRKDDEKAHTAHILTPSNENTLRVCNSNYTHMKPYNRVSDTIREMTLYIINCEVHRRYSRIGLMSLKYS